MSTCRKGRQRPIPFDCKLGTGHGGGCSPYTHKPSGNWLTSGFTLSTSTPRGDR
jgi:hypothetical protein